MEPGTRDGRASISPSERSWRDAPPTSEAPRSESPQPPSPPGLDDPRDPFWSSPVSSPAGASPDDHTRPQRRRFGFRFEPRYRLAAAPFAVNAEHTYVEVDRRVDGGGCGTLHARFGPWMVETSLDNVEAVHVTGPYRVLKTIGPPHLSLADRGLTFATNHDRGVCIRFREPVSGIDPMGLVHHPALTVTVNDVDGLRAALAEDA